MNPSLPVRLSLEDLRVELGEVLPFTPVAGVNGGRSGQALKEGEESGAFVLDCCVYSFINRHLAARRCLGGPSSPVSTPEVGDKAASGIRHAGSHKYTHAQQPGAHIHVDRE